MREAVRLGPNSLFFLPETRLNARREHANEEKTRARGQAYEEIKSGKVKSLSHDEVFGKYKK